LFVGIETLLFIGSDATVARNAAKRNNHDGLGSVLIRTPPDKRLEAASTLVL
jgi:hypothetical protein